MQSTLYYDGSIGLIDNSTWGQNLTGVFHSSAVLGDLDSDNKTDLIVMGCTAGGVDTCTTADKIRVYINNGTTLNENSTWESNLTSLGYGSLALGDIDNDGHLDLVALGDLGGGTGDVKIYINNGTTLNENSTWESNLTGVDAYAGAVALGDVDNDGDLDLALSGAYPSSDNGIYINNGTSFVKSSTWLASLPYIGHGLGTGALIFGDVDNDNDLDLVFAGSHGGGIYDNIYRNNGTTLVGNPVGCDPCGLYPWPAQSLGDYDNDKDLDMAYMGVGDVLYIYNNTNGTFDRSQLVESFYDGSVTFGDYDNDGDLDMVAIGKEPVGGQPFIFNNNKTFFQYDTSADANLSDYFIQGAVAWGDLDNDLDLDLIITAFDDSPSNRYITKIYISNASLTQPNNLPQPPTSGFNAIYSSGAVSFGWYNGSDTETNTSGLYYNLRIGTASNKNSVVTGVYGGGEDNGYFGNMMQRKNITITRNWDAGTTYYWSVQTIDTGLATSNWSTEQTFTTPIDTSLPNITLIAPSDGYYSNNMTVVFNASVVDASGLKNVSIWADFSGSFIINETNSSGLNNTYYVFKRNLSQGTYLWKYQAYDNSTAFNYANSSTRVVYVDLYAPQVNLISPSNSSSWTSSSTVTFSYNVTDFAIANCSLIINGAIDQTDDSIIINTTQTFSKTLSNANYNWSVNCTDNVNRMNSSGTFGLTVSYGSGGGTGGTGGSGGGGGGGGVTPKNVTNATEIIACIENWSCGLWNECVNGSQTRICQDLNECGTELEKPITEKKCGEKAIEKIVALVDKIKIYLIVFGAIVLIIIFYFIYVNKFRRWHKKKPRIKW